MEELQQTQGQPQDPSTEQEHPQYERRSATQGVYAGEERRKADLQLDDMARGQQDA